MKNAALAAAVCGFIATASSCSLFYGPELPVAVTVRHLDSEIVENLGVGEDWQNARYAVNGASLEPQGEVSVDLTTWDDLTISTHHEEYDDAFIDVGSGTYEEPLRALVKGGETEIGVRVYTTVYEQRSAGSVGGDTYALWSDRFLVTLSY